MHIKELYLLILTLLIFCKEKQKTTHLMDRLNYLLKIKLDELFVLEKEYIKTYKHKYQTNRDIAHAKVLACHKEIIEILKSNYDKFS